MVWHVAFSLLEGWFALVVIFRYVNLVLPCGVLVSLVCLLMPLPEASIRTLGAPTVGDRCGVGFNQVDAAISPGISRDRDDKRSHPSRLVGKSSWRTERANHHSGMEGVKLKPITRRGIRRTRMG